MRGASGTSLARIYLRKQFEFLFSKPCFSSEKQWFTTFLRHRGKFARHAFPSLSRRRNVMNPRNSKSMVTNVAWAGIALGWLVFSSPVSGQEPKLRSTLLGHSDEVRALAFSSDGTVLASGGKDNRVKFWDLAQAK
jgi:WD40 repeat protein